MRVTMSGSYHPFHNFSVLFVGSVAQHYSDGKRSPESIYQFTLAKETEQLAI